MQFSPLILFVSVLLVAPLVNIEATKAMYAYRDPHIYSVQQGYQLCDYFTDVWFPCFESAYFSAYCKFKKVPGYTEVSAIQLVFKANDGVTTEVYTVTNPYSPLKTMFDSGNTALNDQYGHVWIKILWTYSYPGYPGYSYIYMQDFNTKTTIYIRQDGMYHLFMYTDDNTALWGTGLLVSGCPAGYLNPFSFGRRKRQVDECQNLTGAKDEAFGDKIVQAICEHDIKYTPDVAESLRQDVENINKLQEMHNSMLKEIEESQASQDKEKGK